MIFDDDVLQEIIALAAEPVALATTHANQYADALQMVENSAAQTMITQVQQDTEALTTLTSEYLAKTLHPSASEMFATGPWVNAFIGGEQKAISILHNAAQMGWNLGRQHLRTDSASLGLGSPSLPETIPATKWVDEAGQRITDAYNEWRGKIQLALNSALSQGDMSPSARASFFDELADKINANLVLRSSLGASTSVQRSHTDAIDMGAQELGVHVKKIWITNFSENTCGMCAALNGTMIDPDEQFDPTATNNGKLIPIFTDLDGPPRHPNCGCVIGIVPDSTPRTDPVELTTPQAGLVDRLVAAFNKLRGNK